MLNIQFLAIAIPALLAATVAVCLYKAHNGSVLRDDWFERRMDDSRWGDTE